MQKKYPQKDPVVCGGAEELLLPGVLSGTWLDEGQDPDEEDGAGQSLCGKTMKYTTEEEAMEIRTKKEEIKRKRRARKKGEK